MTRKRLFWFFIVCLLVNIAVAWWIRVPGYMDAEYYFTTAQRVANGDGWTEPYLWNYLDDPEAIPHPSHLYWMPLTTLVAAVPMMAFGDSFRVAQLPFLLVSTAIPILTVMLAYRLHKNSRWAFQAGFFALFSGFYIPYLTSTDTFSLYALVGGSVLYVTSEAIQRNNRRYWLIAGGLAGLAHLTRADGVLLLGLAWIALAWSRRDLLKGTLWLVGGYVVVMSPWFVRNLIITGRLFPSAAGRTIWLLTYNELFAYPADTLTPARWWQAGIADLIRARLFALGVNLQRLIAENGMIFLLPIMVIGATRFWEKAIVRITALYFLLLLGLMSFVFPFAGSYGGFFHSSIAAMPVLWVVAPAGLEVAIDWLGARRGWKNGSSQVVLSRCAIVLAALLSGYLFWSKVIGPSIQAPRWERSMRDYREVGAALLSLDSSPDLVAVNNPPGFYLATDIQAVVIPDGALETLEQVVSRYQVSWVVLDVNRPVGLSALYARQITPEWMDLATVLEAEDGSVIEIFKVVTRETEPG